VRELGHLPTGDLCDHLVEQLPGSVRRDDVVVVALRTVGSTDRAHADVLTHRLGDLSGARRRFREWLERVDVPAAAAIDLLLAIGEALANALEHGDPAGLPSLEAGIDGNQVVACVRNRGTWEPDTSASANAGRGRGLTIMHATVDSVEIRADQNGTAVRLTKRLERVEVGADASGA
jgi:anti-sigma regulatory factor (Ser/Thr protein kinase)